MLEEYEGWMECWWLGEEDGYWGYDLVWVEDKREGGI